VFEELRITALGVIDEAVLEPGPGLCVVTGETGAGKTMVVTGLGLLLGARSDADLVRAGARQARIEGRVLVGERSGAAALAEQAGAELDAGILILGRAISAEGRSRAFAGGASVPAALLTELSEHLVAIHGQADQHRLLQPRRQRDALDRYDAVTIGPLLADYRRLYQRLTEVEAWLHDLETQTRDRAREADLLRFGLGEIERAMPRPGEDRELRAEEDRLSHADSLRAGAEQAREALSGSDVGDGAFGAADALSQVANARHALEAVREHDPDAAMLAERTAEIGYLLTDLAGDVAAYASELDTQPERLAWVQSRRSELSTLTRKYGATIDEVIAWSEHAVRRLTDLDSTDERIAALRAERTAIRGELSAAAETLTTSRRLAAQPLSASMTTELHALAMPDARLTISVTSTPDPTGLSVGGADVAFGPHGVDHVEFLLAPAAGLAARPLGKGASGGELSRVMLAVEVVLADSSAVPTFVFDEVDAGVGGKAAVEVGRRLARLARSAQVVVVTHLPQVAAFADRHYVVVKSDDGSVTGSGVCALDEPGRVRELSRMMAGLEESETAAAHAEELLATARADRTGDTAAGAQPRRR
jgi:DNA repair protein RecN (Recombination protein N)